MGAINLAIILTRDVMRDQAQRLTQDISSCELWSCYIGQKAHNLRLVDADHSLWGPSKDTRPGGN